MEIDITQIIYLLGGWGVIVGGLSIWIGKLLADRASIHWQSQQAKQIENLSHELNMYGTAANAAISSFGTGQQLSQRKKLEAVESLWIAVLKLREAASPASFFHDMLTVDEQQRIHEDDRTMNLARQVDDDLMHSVIMETNALELNRLYFGDYLWSVFFRYRAFLGRICRFITDAVGGKTLPDWRKDNATIDLLRGVLEEDEIEIIVNKRFGSVSTASQMIEKKILTAIRAIVSGKQSSQESFLNASEVTEATLDSRKGNE